MLPTVSPTVMTTQVNGQCCEDINKDHNDNNSLMMLESIKLLTEQVEQLKIMMSKLRTHPDSLIACGSEMSGEDKAIDCSRCEREGHNCRGGSSVRSSAEIRMAWNQPSAMGQDKNCRLCDHTVNQMCMCNNTCYNTTRVDLLAVNPTKAYHVSGSVNGAPVRFMLDTGATVSLIREDVRRKVVGANTTLAKCNLRLVGVEGSAIAILGVATLETLFASIIVTGDFIVAKTLSTEAIIGLDFLEQNHCTINTEQKVLHLCGKALPLKGAEDCAKTPVDMPQTTSASLSESLRIPPYSEIEATAEVAMLKHTVASGTVWVTESFHTTDLPVIVANALVTPQQDNGTVTIPLRIINPSADAVTLHKGTKVAQIDRTDPSAVVAGIDQPTKPCDSSDLDPQVKEVLWSMVQEGGARLDKSQQQKLYHLLLAFSDTFAFTDKQLGRTSNLLHTIKQRHYPTLLQSMGFTSGAGQEEGRVSKILRRLPQAQCCHPERCLPPAKNR